MGVGRAGTRVTVTFRDHAATAQAGADGKWQVRVATGKAGGPFDLRIKGTRDVTSPQGYWSGEVWGGRRPSKYVVA